MKKSTQELVAAIEATRDRNYASSCYTGDLGKRDAQDKLREAIISIVRNRDYLFRD